MLLTKFQFFPKLPQIQHKLTNIVTLEVWLKRDRPALSTLKMFWRDVQRIYFFFGLFCFGSYESLACVSNHTIDSIKGEGHSKSKFIMFCVLSQNHQHCFLNDTWILKQIVWKLKNEFSKISLSLSCMALTKNISIVFKFFKTNVPG